MTLYYMRAAGTMLEAWSLAELAELAQCAIDAGDEIDRLRARDPATPARLLTRQEFATLIATLSRTAHERAT